MASPTSPFLAACWRKPVGYTPVWFMRQAGRSLPEFRAIRQKHDFMEVCRQPELCAEVTLQPVRRLGVDAAILFADIMTPLIGIGFDVELVEHQGPVIRQPVATISDLDRFRELNPEEDLPFVGKTVRMVKAELGKRVPLIGFAGAPFTLAAYLIEGGASRSFADTKALMYTQNGLWQGLMERLSELTEVYLQSQAESGADALQLFDSWVGCLSPSDYATYVHPYTEKLLGRLRKLGKPVIHFGTNTATLLDQMRDEGGTVIGVDWRIGLDSAWKVLGSGLAVQGNLDPAVLLGPWEIVQKQTMGVLRQAAGRDGHIFNLGHGILPETPLDNLMRLVDFVHSVDTVDLVGI
ncbi:MAG: uroporphyrinogen decarboxylase [Ktedonobacterales bacterium]